jgi:hypothetical protein
VESLLGPFWIYQTVSLGTWGNKGKKKGRDPIRKDPAPVQPGLRASDSQSLAIRPMGSLLLPPTKPPSMEASAESSKPKNAPMAPLLTVCAIWA